MEKKDRSNIHLEELDNFDFTYEGDWKIEKKKKLLQGSTGNIKKIQVNLIKSGLSDLKEKIGDMSEEEKEIENPNEIGDIVKKILEFNRQQGQGLKILTPNQMLCRLPISLVQLKARNNSEKLKN